VQGLASYFGGCYNDERKLTENDLCSDVLLIRSGMNRYGNEENTSRNQTVHVAWLFHAGNFASVSRTIHAFFALSLTFSLEE